MSSTFQIYKPAIIGARQAGINPKLSLRAKMQALTAIGYDLEHHSYHVESVALLKKLINDFYPPKAFCPTQLGKILGLNGGMELSELAGSTPSYLANAALVLGSEWGAAHSTNVVLGVADALSKPGTRIPKPWQLLKIWDVLQENMRDNNPPYTAYNRFFNSFWDYALHVFYAHYEKPISTRKEKNINIVHDYLSVVSRIAVGSDVYSQVISTPKIQCFGYRTYYTKTPMRMISPKDFHIIESQYDLLPATRKAIGVSKFIV